VRREGAIYAFRQPKFSTCSWKMLWKRAASPL
jgi:hypothetical protein